jgi:hypothetical protein
MHSGTTAARRLSLSLAVLLLAGPASAQDNPAHMHIGHVVTAFPRTPDGAGLLPTAIAEADIAIRHVELALRDTDDLGAIQTHAAHVLHAVDPSQVENGPGLGFGVIAGAEGVAQHVELAAGSEGASDAVQTHAVHVAAAARAVAERARELASLAVEVGEAQDAATAAEIAARMGTLANQLLEGADVDGDGQIGWGNGEGGLRHAEQHMGFMTQAEGIE